MTDQPQAAAPDAAQETAPAAKKRSGGLNSMLLADLKSMAAGLGVAGAGSMKKAQLVEAIKAAQAGGGSAKAQAPREESKARPPQDEPRQDEPRQDEPR